MSMMNRPADATDVGEIVASMRDYESAQKTVSKLIAAEVPAREIAIVGQGARTIERITGRLGYAVAARSGAINGVLIGLLLSAVLVLGNPEAPIQLFVGFVLIGVALGMVMSLVSFAIVRRRRDFASVTQLAADHYEVTVQAASLAKARQALGHERSAPVRPPYDPDEPPRYGERVARGVDPASVARSGSAAAGTHAIPPRPADPAPRYGERVAEAAPVSASEPVSAAGAVAESDAGLAPQAQQRSGDRASEAQESDARESEDRESEAPTSEAANSEAEKSEAENSEEQAPEEQVPNEQQASAERKPDATA